MATPDAHAADTGDTSPDGAAGDSFATVAPDHVRTTAGAGPTARRRTSVVTRLGLAAVGVALLSIIVTAIVGLGSGRDVGEELADDRLSAVRGGAVSSIAQLLSEWRRDAALLADGPAAADVIGSFSAAYDEIGEPTDQQVGRVTEWYEDELVPALADVRGTAPSLRTVLPTAPSAIALQSVALADADEDADEPDRDEADRAAVERRAEADAAVVESWVTVADELGGPFDEAAERLDLLDVLLVDTQNRIVYSVARGPDLGTDLRSGPYGGSALARLSLDVQLRPEDGARLGDIAPYAPALDRPAAVAAAPVVDADGSVAGAVVVVHDGSRLDEVVSVGTGDLAPLGETGENVVVGRDGIVRTDLRVHRESPSTFLENAVESGALDDAAAQRIEALGTAATVFEVDDDVLDADAVADGTPLVVTDPLGREIVAFVAAFDDPDLDWFVSSQITVEEIDSAVESFRTDVIRIGAVALLVLSLLAVAWANRLIRPVRLIGDRLDRDIDPSEVAEAVRQGPVEFGRLADDVTVMQERLDLQRAEVEVANSRRRELLRTLLPSAIVARVETGDRDVFDRVPSASLIVAVLDGLSDLATSESVAGGRSRFHAVTSAIDTLCDRHAVERVKIIGDSVLIACGHDRPLLDHAPRAVAFAEEAVEIAEASGDGGVHARFAVHTGPVSVGLGGGRRLVYDVWGPTVSEAFLLSRTGSRSDIVVSSATLSLLPPDVVEAADQVDDDRPELGWRLATRPVAVAGESDRPASGEEVAT